MDFFIVAGMLALGAILGVVISDVGRSARLMIVRAIRAKIEEVDWRIRARTAHRMEVRSLIPVARRYLDVTAGIIDQHEDSEAYDAAVDARNTLTERLTFIEERDPALCSRSDDDPLEADIREFNVRSAREGRPLKKLGLRASVPTNAA